MTSANIKDVSVSNIPQSNSYNSPKSKEDTREKFFSLMSDSVKSQMAVNSVSGAKTADLSGVSKGVGKVDFARGAAEAGTADTGKKMDKAAARDLIREYAEAVKKEIKDKSNTSEEELTLVMEELGLTLADLKNPNDLAMLFSRLEGGLDTIELLVDPGFKGLMDDITDLTRELTLGLDMSLEEMEKLIDEEPFFGEAFDISFGESESEGILIEDIRGNINIRQEIPTENNETAPKEPEEAEAGIAEALNSKLQKGDFENNKNNPQTGGDSNTFAKTEVNMTHRGEDSLPMDNRG